MATLFSIDFGDGFVFFFESSEKALDHADGRHGGYRLPQRIGVFEDGVLIREVDIRLRLGSLMIYVAQRFEKLAEIYPQFGPVYERVLQGTGSIEDTDLLRDEAISEHQRIVKFHDRGNQSQIYYHGTSVWYGISQGWWIPVLRHAFGEDRSRWHEMYRQFDLMP